MPEGFMLWFYYMALSVLALITFAYLFRTMIGPTFFDRILGVNNISTLITVMIAILSVVQQQQYLVDVALIYSMLGFVTTVIVCKAYLRSHNKESGGYYRFMQMEMQMEQRLQTQEREQEKQELLRKQQEEEEREKKQKKSSGSGVSSEGSLEKEEESGESGEMEESGESGKENGNDT